MDRFVSFIILSFLLVPFARAEPVVIAYDSDNGRGTMGNLNAGDIEVVRFTPEHPCSLLALSFLPTGTGTVEWHIWSDDGGGMPDPENDLVEPFEYIVEDADDWLEIDITEFGLHMDVPVDFCIGLVYREDGVHLSYDNTNVVEQRSLVKLGDTWYLTGQGNNYHLRAVVEYYNERSPEDYFFHDVSAEAGVGGMSRVAWGDYDNDGWEDLLVNGRILYRNMQDGTFEDVSADAGIVAGNPANSGSWGDFDDDGWLDFYATNDGANIQDRLYHNNGDGTFEFANDRYWLYNGSDPTSASGWGDADGDGLLEIYIANSEIWDDNNPNNSQYFQDYLFRFSLQDEVFLDITRDADILGERHYGRGVAWCDFDADGDMDIYISNYRLHPNYLLVNQGNMTFREQAERYGVRGNMVMGAFGHTIGSAWGDYDNDGDFDLMVGNLAHPRFLNFSDKCMLYSNSGSPRYLFDDVREEAGIAYFETASSVAWGDYDNDGWIDLFITAVYEGRQPHFYHNRGDGTFENINYPSGFYTRCYNSWGVAWCDWDHDGDLDIAVGGNHPGLFRNDAEIGHYLQLKLRGTDANSFAYGSRAAVHYEDLHQLRQVEAGMGTGACQNMLTLHYGLGGSIREDVVISVDSVVVSWLGGATDRFYNVRADRRYIIDQDQGLLYTPGDGEDVIVPLAFSLDNPFPNPFNSQINLTCRLGRESALRIEIFNLNGQKTATLFEGTTGPGVIQLSWNAADQPAGSYIIQASHDRGIASRMVTLVR